MSAQFPIVPPFPGVPPLAREAAYAVTAAQVAAGSVEQIINIQLGFAANQYRFGANPSGPDQTFSPGALPAYGFFQVQTVNVQFEATADFDPGPALPTGNFNANALLQPDSVIEFSINADSSINSHPVEQGGFEAYNRVQEPISIRMKLCCMGKNQNQQAFISALQSLREGTQVLTIATPDATYPNMVLKSFGYKKASDQGFVTIWADTQWQEERSTNVEVSAPPTVQPQGAATSNLGSLQPAAPTAQAQSIIANPPVVPGALPPGYAGTQPQSGYAF